MSSNWQSENLGDRILKAVDEIIASGEFQKLNSVVSETVSAAMSEVGKQLEAAGKSTKESVEKSRTTTEKKGRFSSVYSEDIELSKHKKLGRNKLQRVGSCSGGVMQTFGTVFSIISGFSLFGALLDFLDGWGSLDSLLAAVLFFAGSVLLTKAGRKKLERIRRAERYIKAMQGISYINLSELALLVHKSEEEVREDVLEMIEKGLFPEGHLDATKKCLIIGDAAYREYIQLEKERRRFLEEEAQAQRPVQKEPEPAAEVTLSGEEKELAAMIQEGNAYIKQLRELNDLIEGEEVSAKLFHLENILKEIFEQLGEHPEQMPQMHKFMDYYLPTTLKLVTAYEEFDGVSAPGADILSSKCEIEKTLDTINLAFEELLNKMFQARVYDVTTDAQVLKTMLAREGLTKEPVFVEK